MLSMRTISSRVFPVFVAVCTLAPLGEAVPAQGQSLRGSRGSMDRQNMMARRHDFTYIETPARVRFFADQGWLVPVESGRDFVVKGDVSFPFARPEVELFVHRLGSQYRRACGERLVVTSLTRPANRQPRNASERSVHPTGMAVDIRYSWNRGCRRWLEEVLVSLESQGVLEATLERRPRHYHVAIFPQQYASYVEVVSARSAARTASVPTPAQEYRVRKGDSLWTIARAHGTTVDELREFNGLESTRIFAGQVIDVPPGS